MLYRGIHWIETELGESLGINLGGDADSIRQLYARMMHNSQLYAKFQADVFGLDWISEKFSQIFIPIYQMFGDEKFQQWPLCLDTYYEKGHPNLRKCLKNK